MTVLKSPLVEKAVRCPACGEHSPQRFFRQRVFVADAKESDQHVVSYKWLAQDVERVHPPFYYLYFCPLCRFTDITDDFVKPPDSPATAQVLKEYRISGASDALMQALGQRIDYEKIDFQSALNMHLLALRIHSLPKDEDIHDAYKLARICLRIAWLHREHGSSVAASEEAGAAGQAIAEDLLPPSQTPAVHANVKPPSQPAPDRPEAGPTVCQLRDGVETMAACWTSFQTRWEGVRQLLRERTREVAKSGMLESPNPYPACLAAMNERIGQLGAELERLKDLCVRDLSGGLVKRRPVSSDGPPPKATPVPLGPVAPAAGQGRPAFQVMNQPAADLACTHEAFLQEVRARWPEAPITERKATLSAIKHFRRALMADARFDSAQNLLRVSPLVIDLLVRCEDFSGALEVVRVMYKSAAEERHQIQERLGKKELGEAEQRKLNKNMKGVTGALERAGDLRRDILEMMVAHDMPKVRQIARDTSARGPALEQALVSGGVPREVVSELKKADMLLGNIKG